MIIRMKDLQTNTKIKLRPKFVKTITFGFAAAITLWPFGIYFREQRYINKERIVNHENIHWVQSRELLGIGFYLLYLLEFLIKLLFYGKKAYYNLSFEREANKNELNQDYLRTRKMYSWVKYIF